MAERFGDTFLVLPQVDVKAIMRKCACSYQVQFADKETAYAQGVLLNYWSVLQTAAGQDSMDTKRHQSMAETSERSCRAGRGAQCKP